MKLHRFMSRAEYDRYAAGEVLHNDRNDRLTRGRATASVGFCWFAEDPEKAKHRLSGIVDFDVCLTVEVPDESVPLMRASWGVYLDPDHGHDHRPRRFNEWCCIEYDRERLPEVGHTCKFAGYAPGPAKLREMFPSLSMFFV